jgi:hypothetical protein
MYIIRITDEKTVWSTTKQEHRWSATIDHDQTICSGPIYIMDARTEVDTTFMKSAAYSYHSNVLKSNIQKTIRRGKLAECLSTTQQLLRQDTADALRRLPVIFPEDTMIHPESFSLVVWLMAAHSKGYQLSTRDEQLVLDAVATACAAPFRYSRDLSAPGELSENGYSLAFRTLYGGMQGDMVMLTKMAKRINSMETLNEWVRAPVPEPFSIKHIIPESIDFHCFPKMVSWCNEKTGISYDHIRSTIWQYWSAPNVRTLIEDIDIQEDYIETYEQIHPLLVAYAMHKIEWVAHHRKKLLTQTRITQFCK